MMMVWYAPDAWQMRHAFGFDAGKFSEPAVEPVVEGHGLN